MDQQAPAMTDAEVAAALVDVTQQLLAELRREHPVPVLVPVAAPPAPVHPVAAAVAKALAPRGIRVCNPGDIRISQDTFVGEVASKDKAFKTFVDIVHGVRAAAIIFRNYQTTHHLYTPYDMASRYAPSNENNTTSYAATLAKFCGITPQTQINVATSSENMRLLLQGCFHAEGTLDYVTDADLRAGIKLALGA